MNGAGGSLLWEGLNKFGRHQGEGAWGPVIGEKTSHSVRSRLLDSSKSRICLSQVFIQQTLLQILGAKI